MKKYLMIIAVVLFALFFSMNVYAAEPTAIEAKASYEEEKATQCELSNEDKVLLQQIAMAEAKDQGIGGMTFVMQTILNRVDSEEFPDTISEVVFEEGQFATVNDDLYKKYEVTENSQKALKLLDVLRNRGQLYFEAPADKTDTWHARNLTYVFEYGDHIFYK